jgi:AcrR family transcriptional regulator
MGPDRTVTAPSSWRADPSTDGYDQIRARIIDATDRHVVRNGITRVRVEEIAVEAGCSRATIYRYFDDRDELVRAVMVRHAAAIADRISVDVDHLDDPAEMLVEGVLLGVEGLRADPCFESFWGPAGQPVTARVAGGSAALNEVITRAMVPLLRRAEATGRLRPEVSSSEAAEWAFLVSVALATLSSPIDRTRAERAAFLHKFLVPALLRPAR